MKFISEFEYFEGLIDSLYVQEREIQYNPLYKVLLIPNLSPLRKLLNSYSVLKITKVPEDILPVVSHPIKESSFSILPHQDLIDRTNLNDTRRWNLFLSRKRRIASTYIIDNEILNRYKNWLIDFLTHNKEIIGKIENPLEIPSEIPINGCDLQKLRKVLETKEFNLEDEIIWTLTAKVFKNDDISKNFLEKILRDLKNRFPFKHHIETWQDPNTILIFDNDSTYHGRYGPSQKSDEFYRMWIVDDKI